MLLGTLGSAANGAAMPAFFLFFGKLIDQLGTLGRVEETPEQRQATLDKINQYVFYFIYLGLVMFVASYFETGFWMQTSDRQSARLKKAYLEAVLKQDIGYFDTEGSTGQTLSRISSDTILVQDAIGEKAGLFLHFMATFVTGFAIGFTQVWRLALVILAVVPLLAVAGGTYAYLLQGLTSKSQQAYAGAGQIAVQSISSVRTVYSFAGEDKAIRSYSKALEETLRLGVRGGITKGLGMGVTYIIMGGSWVLNFWYASELVSKQRATPGKALTTMFNVLFGGMAIGQAMPYLSNFANGRAAGYNIFQVLERKPLIASSEKGHTLKAVTGSIELRNVTFAYPSRPDVQIFKDFSLEIPAGKTVALVGASGSGKSSVVALIERFYEPISGAVLLDGNDIKTLQLSWLRRQIGLVSQEPALFATSILNNILYGNPDATREEVEAAARAANAHEFIMAFPQQYDTLVGEKGVQMSGGQKQRIAIARAVLRNPSILLLDEATSALDAESERVVQEALDGLMGGGRTTVVVAHRLSTIRNADLIAVIQEGNVIELGNHDELLRIGENGAYASLIRLQQNVQNKEESRAVRLAQRKSDLGYGDGSIADGSSLPSIRHTLSFSLSMQSAGEHSVIMDPKTLRIAKASAPSFWRLLKMNSPEWPWALLGSASACVTGTFNPFFALILSGVISEYFVLPGMRGRVLKYCYYALTMSGGGIFVYLASFGGFGVAGERLVKRVREKAFKAILQQEIGWFDLDENRSTALASRLEADATVVKSSVMERLSVLLQTVGSLSVALVVALVLSWRMALVGIAVFPIYLSSAFCQTLLMKGFSGDLNKAYAKAGAIAGEAVLNIRTVQAFGAESKVLGLFEGELAKPLRDSFKKSQIAGTGLGLCNFLTQSAEALHFWYAMTLVRENKNSFAEVFKTFMVLIVTTFALAESFTLAPDIAKGSTVLGSIFAIIDRRTAIDADDESGTKLVKLQGNIELRKVDFRYPCRPDVPIFKDLNLKVRPGQIMALVGPSGGGKSSVIALIERFYDPVAGHVLIDNKDIRKFNLRWLRQQMALVSQEPVLFNTTIRENILYGRDGATEAEMVEAARAANAHTFISSLPDGYNTSVGEAGTQMSGGQKQRIAIARAVLKSPTVLLLDEATSALDAESEGVVQAALERLMEGRTTVVIAHRLSTIRNAHEIAVIYQGTVAEIGTHQQLISRPGSVYASLVELQSKSSS
ncbi:hypothetical protein CBR_g17091 [Chara braunii]|uniref:Uncharacterized protein n=1 Tax=Chara braunii TaxID=69332 RepID=A0A388KUM1_CHABU|nr:hypothetical protein CBR_g17091 [Chara braunii]|eukprot:GBG73751.1 hypothetical protein CBR_g17091 [Chara braunii]